MPHRPWLISYHLRLVLTHFSVRGTTASYFLSSMSYFFTIDPTDFEFDTTDSVRKYDIINGSGKMGTIVARTRKDGSKAFTAQIVIKKGGAIVHREAETFDRKQAAPGDFGAEHNEVDQPGEYGERNSES
jgi:hypothetical protein